MSSADHSHPVHVALLAFPFGSHAAPLLALGRSLAAAAPSAAFSFLSSAASNAALARSSAAGAAPANLRFYDVDGGNPAGFVRPTDEGPEGEVGRFVAATPANFRAALAAAEEGSGGRRVSCVVSDAFLWMAGELAAEMGAKWVALFAGGPASLAAHLHSDLIRRTVGVVSAQAMASRADEALEFIPALAFLRIGDLPEGVIWNIDSVFARLLDCMADELPRTAAVVLNTYLGLDPLLDPEFRSRFASFLPVGPLNLLAPLPPAPDDHGCLPWLDRHPPASVAYVSFGTVAFLSPSEVAELASGLERSGAPFLWSLREEAARKHLPAGFSDRVGPRGRVVPWAPQAAALGHAAVGAFVTHCGWNSVMESLAGGVPMVCRPFLGDQRINARVVSHVWRVGVGIDGGGALTCDGVAAALDVVMRKEEGRRMRERAGELREMAVRAVGPGGSSTQNLKSLVEIAVSSS